MLSVHDQHQLLFEHRLCRDVRPREGESHAQIELAFGNRLFDGAGGQIFDADFHARVARKDLRDNGWNQRAVVGMDHSQPQASAHHIFQLVERNTGVLHLLERALGKPAKELSRLGEPDPSTHAIEQRHPKQLLQLADLMG